MGKNNCNHKENRREDWGTPRDLFNRLDDIYNFEVDLCARDDNALCGRWITPEVDFLALPLSDNWLSTPAWKWCNPPYGKCGCGPFVDKLMDLYNVVTLVPFSPGSKWFRKIWTHASYVVVIHGRLQFHGAPNRAMFDSCLAVRNGPSVLWEVPPGIENIGTVVKTQILWEGLDDTGR